MSGKLVKEIDIVNEIAQKRSSPKKRIAQIVRDVLEIVECEVAGGSRVQFPGFGTFEKHITQKRVRYSFKEKKALPCSEKVVPSFTAGRRFRQKVDEKSAKSLDCDKK